MEKVSTVGRFKILYVADSFYIGAKGYRLFRYDFNKGRKEYWKTIEDKYAVFSFCSLTRRFFRAEISGFYDLHNGNALIVAKKSFFMLNKDNGKIRKVFSVPRGSRPLKICADKHNRLYFGEYFNIKRQDVNIYSSMDNGTTWNIVYTFPAGTITHVHSINYDKYTDRVWVCTGDDDNECIIGYTDNGFESFHTVFRGGQEFRCCNLFFYPDYIVYATDSQFITNRVRMFRRDTLELTDLQEIQGSAIKCGQVGNLAFLSTAVEPSEVNTDKCSFLWYSKDGRKWQQLYDAEKDCLPAVFQFGSFEFPQYSVREEQMKTLYFSGRALRKVDGRTIALDLQ